MEGASPVTILEHCGVRPPPNTVAVKSLPLNFFDLIWLTFHPLGRVMFFEFPYSTTHFIQHTVPKLKSSLSLALQHFTPLAGKLSTPSNSKCSTDDFRIRYVDGDSVSVTFAECRGDHDLSHYCGNHARDGNVLKPLVPRLPPGGTCVDACGESCCVAPVFAVQVTVFPHRAICIGMTNSHVVADGRTMFNFVRAWASIAKQVNISDAKHDVIPNYDRSLIKDPHGLATMLVEVLGPLLKQIGHQQKKDIVQDASNIKVRATFSITGTKIQALKKIVSTKRPTLTHVSSFTVVCAYLWTCFAKMRATVWEEVHNLEEAQNFGFAMDCRARLDPPLPASYFGNCLVHCLGVEKGRVMIGDDGLAAAAEVLGNAISLKANSKQGPLHSSDKWMEEFSGALRGEWCMGIAGSPKLDYYNDIEFGWGKPLKFEFVEEALFLSRCKDSKTDLEVGVILPQNEMDVFSNVFTQGLQSLQG